MRDLKNILFFAGLIFISRFIPHWPNFTALGASIVGMSFFTDDSISKLNNTLRIILIPLAGMLFSDLILEFHDQILWVYGSIILSGITLSLFKTNNPNKLKIAPLQVLNRSLINSGLFYLITNFGVWSQSNGFYSKDFKGLVQCYFAGIPFALNDLISTLLYSSLALIIYQLVIQKNKKILA